MFKHPGNKLRMLSEIAFIVFSIASIGYGLFFLTEGDTLIGLFTMGIGIFVSYVTGLLMCAFGKLVENSEKLVRAKEEEKAREQKENTTKSIVVNKEEKQE